MSTHLVPPVPGTGRYGRLRGLGPPAALAPLPGQAEGLAPQVPLVPAVGRVHAAALRREVQRGLDRAVRQLCIGKVCEARVSSC